ncbi:MAG: methyltransferase domain-containing protein [Solirubrobacteraceae bacterium]|nr:methyltransferase domain-containing protein [Solirubrobacteraceae bacterium]
MAVPTTRERWERDRLVATAYDLVVEREAPVRAAGKALWGCDTRELFRAIDRIGSAPPGTRVLDVPCGGGVALRGLRPGQDVDYVAADLSPTMLARAEAMARRRGVADRVRLEQVDIAALPFDDGAFDLVQSYNGLHCLAEPADALVELRRVLRPGGELRMTCVIAGVGVRQDAAIRTLRRLGIFGVVGTARDLEWWLRSAGFGAVTIRRTGALALVDAG